MDSASSPCCKSWQSTQPLLQIKLIRQIANATLQVRFCNAQVSDWQSSYGFIGRSWFGLFALVGAKFRLGAALGFHYLPPPDQELAACASGNQHSRRTGALPKRR